jgi:predicted metallopeptidase
MSARNRPKRKGMVDQDPLYAIFEKHLHSGEFDRLPETELVEAIVHEYLVFLVTQGMAPHAQASAMREDLMLEVRDMLKMKTYGHFNLRHYTSLRRKSG